jgi:hypothetical protein
MNHIAASALPRQQTGLAILIGQDRWDLVLGVGNEVAVTITL